METTEIKIKFRYTPEVVPLTRHVLVDKKIIDETLTAAEIGKEYDKDESIVLTIQNLFTCQKY